MEIVGNIPVEEQEMTIRRDDWSVEVINRICTSIREWALENRKSIYILASFAYHNIGCTCTTVTSDK